MSSLQVGLAVAGGLILGGVIAYNTWNARRNEPRQAQPEASGVAGDGERVEPAIASAPMAQPDRVEPSFDGDAAMPALGPLPAPEKRPGLDALIDVIAPIAQARGVAVIMNDRPDLAARFDCDGVHIGQSDGTLAEARRIVGKERMVGVTCHDSRHLAMEAAEGGADYVAFGPGRAPEVAELTTRAEPEILSIWQETMEIPCVAIGGITADNAQGLAAAGADFLAVSAGVWNHPQGPEAAVKALNAAIAQGLAARG